MSNPRTLVVGLGANLGARADSLRGAVGELRRLASKERPFRVSSLYETEPLGPAQPRFLNAAVLLSTPLTPLALLDELQAIEARYGRTRTVRWGPRTLDLDVLWIEGTAVSHPRLRVPHPELENRAFALLPLLEVAPAATTADGLSLRSVAESLPVTGIARIQGPEWVDAPTST